MKLRRSWSLSLLLLSATGGLFAACALPSKSKNSVSVQEYNELVDKHNALVADFNTTADGSVATEEASIIQTQDVVKLNQAVKAFNEAAADYEDVAKFELAGLTFSEVPGLATKLKPKTTVLEEKRSNALGAIGALETDIVKSLQKIQANAYNIHGTGSGMVSRARVAGIESNYLAQGNSLAAMKELINRRADAIYEKLKSDLELALRKNSSKSSATTLPVLPSPAPEKKVELNSSEQPVAALKPNATGSDDISSVRIDNGKVIVENSSATSLATWASNQGYRADAAEDSVIMSRQTGSIVGFASANDPAQMGSALEQMLGHIKQSLNSNSDDLELVFALDYSGSMANEIQGVIDNLVKITESLKAVTAAGRGVKIAIVTFGSEKRAGVPADKSGPHVNLALTSNLAEVATTLENLRKNYATDNHSTDPGEASFQGLELVADGIDFHSTNRKVILITDEPSWELRTGQQDYVNSVYAKLKAKGIPIAVYPLVIKNN